MTSFFPDLNVWLALSVASHRHNAQAWTWLNVMPQEPRLIFSRYTQMGLLRLLTNEAVMGEQTLTIRKAWSVYDEWLSDERVEFYPESRDLDALFRKATEPFGRKKATKWIGDCYLLAYAQATHAWLITFDRGLYDLAGKEGCPAIVPA